MIQSVANHSVIQALKSSIPIFTFGEEVRGIMGKEVCIQAFTRGHKF